LRRLHSYRSSTPVQTVSPTTLESEFGAEISITSSHVLHGSDDFDGVIDRTDQASL